MEGKDKPQTGENISDNRRMSTTDTSTRKRYG